MKLRKESKVQRHKKIHFENKLAGCFRKKVKDPWKSSLKLQHACYTYSTCAIMETIHRLINEDTHKKIKSLENYCHSIWGSFNATI
jgi:hypothetical protein